MTEEEIYKPLLSKMPKNVPIEELHEISACLENLSKTELYFLIEAIKEIEKTT